MTMMKANEANVLPCMVETHLLAIHLFIQKVKRHDIQRRKKQPYNLYDYIDENPSYLPSPKILFWRTTTVFFLFLQFVYSFHKNLSNVNSIK